MLVNLMILTGTGQGIVISAMYGKALDHQAANQTIRTIWAYAYPMIRRSRLIG